LQELLLQRCLAFLPNEPWRLPRASLLLQARSNVLRQWQRRSQRLAFEVHLAKERKAVVANRRFAGELRSLLVDL
jgi:hypothetical protein